MFPPLRPPPRPHSPSGHRSQSSLSQSSLRSESSLSTTSNDSAQIMPPPTGRRSPYTQPSQARPSTSGGPGPSQSVSNLQADYRQQIRTSVDGGGIRAISPNMPGQQIGHRARQHSQGFFEPSLPHATANNNGLSASQIAAQAAMHHMSPPLSSLRNERKGSYPGLAPINTMPPPARRNPSDVSSPQVMSAGGFAYSNNRSAAAAAASVAFPNARTPLPSPGLPPPQFTRFPDPPPEKESKSKSSKMKLFSKPSKISLSKDKDSKVPPSMPSPGKGAINTNLLRTGFPNQSVTSLAEQGSSGGSIYSSANASTSTLVPVTSEREKEKRHNFLSRQKHKLKDDPPQLSLSSAHSNSQPTNPEKPQPLYSFTPDSPGASTFSKSMSGFSGLDLRHGGRALREKKKEEKAAAKMELAPIPSNTSQGGVGDFFGPASYETVLGPPSVATTGIYALPNDTMPPISVQQFGSVGASMGLPNLGVDDAWPLLKARLLNIFSGEDLRTPVEDFNILVGAHIRRCVCRKSPVMVVEDVRELLQTGFSSLAQTLRGVADDRLVTKLVEMWINVYSSILPFLQAVFLPLDLEFRGRGMIMSTKEAHEFWGAMPEALKSDERPSSAGGTAQMPTLGEELDVRRIILITFRDTVILPRHESLMAIFSRLSLDSINASASPDPNAAGRQHARSDPATTGAERPGTAGSLSPNMSSFNSQGSTLLDAASSNSSGLANRSRATSNTSAGSFGTNMPHLNSPITGPGSFSATNQPPSPLPPTDPTKITETVARMLQCLYVLASCQTGDVGQGVVERLTGALKYNWLGRGRTGRDRRGWVGMKHPPGQRVGLVGA